MAASCSALIITSPVVQKPSEITFVLARWRAGKPLQFVSKTLPSQLCTVKITLDINSENPFLPFVLYHPFGVTVEHVSPFHILHVVVRVLDCRGKSFSPLEKSV